MNCMIKTVNRVGRNTEEPLEPYRAKRKSAKDRSDYKMDVLQKIAKSLESDDKQ